VTTPIFLPSPQSINHHRYILDPSLVLSEHGLLITKQLALQAEIWIAHGLWHILDNASIYIHQPELAAMTSDTMAGEALNDVQFENWTSPPLRTNYRSGHGQGLVGILQHWQQFLASTPPSRFIIYWLGDKLWESRLPDDFTMTDFADWAALNQDLEQFISATESGANPSTGKLQTLLDLALQETIALAAYLESVAILTRSSAPLTAKTSEHTSVPLLCDRLAQWQIPCQQVVSETTWVNLERQYCNDLLVRAGIAKLCWQNLNFDLLHLIVPAAKKFPRSFNVWQESNSFWYKLNLEDSTHSTSLA
jgi:hypothetical protein